MKKVAYISGAITGQDDYRERFAEAEKALTAAGYTVLNPAVLPEGLAPGEYMRICMAMVDVADTIVMLPGWFGSKGACLEWEYAGYSGKTVRYWTRCDTCKWRDSFSGYCCRDDSPRCAEPTSAEHACEGWEKRPYL